MERFIEVVLDFFRPKLHKVLGDFNKTLNKLDQIVEHHENLQAKAHAAIQAAEKKIADADAVVTRATSVRGKIADLIS